MIVQYLKGHEPHHDVKDLQGINKFRMEPKSITNKEAIKEYMNSHSIRGAEGSP